MRDIEIGIDTSKKLLSINQKGDEFFLNYNLNHRRYNLLISSDYEREEIDKNLEKLSSVVSWIEENLKDIHKQAIEENYNYILQNCVSEKIYEVLEELENSDFIDQVVKSYGTDIAEEMLNDTKRYYKIARERAFDRFVTKEDLFDNTYSKNCRIYFENDSVNLISIYFEEKMKSKKEVFLNKNKFKIDYKTKFKI